MPQIDPLEIRVEADTTEADRKIQVFARDTGKRIDQVRVIELEAKSGSLFVELTKARTELNKLAKISREIPEKFNDKTFVRKFKNAKISVNNLADQMTNVNGKIRNIKNTGDEATSRLSRQFNKLGLVARQAGAQIVAAFSFRFILQQIGKLGDAFQEFESAFAGFRKTLEASESEFKAIEKGIVNLSKRIPATVKELSRIAEVGGQFGIQAENILVFTETVAKLSSTIEGVDAEKAATQLARVLALTGDTTGNIDKLASSLVELGNNFKANEGEILNFAERIAGAGGIVGLTSSEILGIATAFVDVGIQAEAGGTAVQKALLTINSAVIDGGKDLQGFAAVAGVSAQEFSDLWENDSSKAFENFVGGLTDAGDDAKTILDELIGTDVRLQRAFLSLANSGDTLTKSISSANGEYGNATALTEEFDKRLKTTDSQLQIQANRWQAWQASVGGSVSQARLAFGEFALTFLPNAWSTIQFIFAAGLSFIKRVGLSIAGIFVGLGGTIGIVVGGIIDIWNGLVSNAKILAFNIGNAFKSIPSVIGGAFNVVLKSLEGLINGGIGLVNKLLGALREVPLLGDKIGNNISTVSFSPVNIGSSAAQFKAFEKVQFNAAAAAKKFTESTILDIGRRIEAEDNALKQTALRLDEEAKITEKSKADARKKELDRIKGEVNEKKKALEEELKKLLDNEKNKTGGASKGGKARTAAAKKALEDKIKLAKEEAKRLEKIEKEKLEVAQDSADKIVKKQKETEDSIRDNVDAVADLREEYQELRDEAVDALQNINQELRELDGEEDNDLAERRLEILEEQKDIEEKIQGLEGKNDTESFRELNQLKQEEIELANELKLINENVTDEVLKQVEAYDKLSETQKILADNEEKRKVLEEQQLVQTAVAQDRDIKIVQDDEDGVKAFVENEKGELIELQDFKVAQDAIEIENQRALLQSKELALLNAISVEADQLRQSYELKAQLAMKHTQIILDESGKRIKINDEEIKKLNRIIKLQKQARINFPKVNSNTSTLSNTTNITNNITQNNTTAGAAIAATDRLGDITNISGL